VGFNLTLKKNWGAITQMVSPAMCILLALWPPEFCLLTATGQVESVVSTQAGVDGAHRQVGAKSPDYVLQSTLQKHGELLSEQL
jgi:hypothetical protein